MSDLPKILVHDNSKGFLNMLKYKYRNRFEIEFLNIEHLDEYNFDDYDYVFFIVNRESDIKNFIYIYYKSVTIFLGVTNINQEDYFTSKYDVIPINLFLPKKELFKYIDYKLKMITIQMTNS